MAVPLSFCLELSGKILCYQAPDCTMSCADLLVPVIPWRFGIMQRWGVVNPQTWIDPNMLGALGQTDDLGTKCPIDDTGSHAKNCSSLV